jgi:molybdopterin/thiamine biosynthesis adenylyltransferase
MGIYDRQEAFKLNTDITVSIVGCGGIGYWVAKLLAMSGVEKLYLYDADVIEETNLNRLDLPMQTLGMNKAGVVKKVINQLRPNCSTYVLPYRFKETLYTDSDYIVDCTDNFASQLEIQEIAKNKGAIYVKAGYDGTHISISNSVAEWGESVDGYTVTPSWCVPAITVAALTVAKILKSWEKAATLDIMDVFTF